LALDSGTLAGSKAAGAGALAGADGAAGAAGAEAGADATGAAAAPVAGVPGFLWQPASARLARAVISNKEKRMKSILPQIKIKSAHEMCEKARQKYNDHKKI
jgi:hypothetical protein